MPEYIDRDMAKEALYKTAEEYDEYDKCDRIEIIALTNADEILNDIPAADVVVVVRCRECGYHYKTYSGWFCSHGVFVNDAVPPDDFYCGYGKRKDGGQDE